MRRPSYGRLRASKGEGDDSTCRVIMRAVQDIITLTLGVQVSATILWRHSCQLYTTLPGYPQPEMNVSSLGRDLTDSQVGYLTGIPEAGKIQMASLLLEHSECRRSCA